MGSSEAGWVFSAIGAICSSLTMSGLGEAGADIDGSAGPALARMNLASFSRSLTGAKADALGSFSQTLYMSYHILLRFKLTQLSLLVSYFYNWNDEL